MGVPSLTQVEEVMSLDSQGSINSLFAMLDELDDGDAVTDDEQTSMVPPIELADLLEPLLEPGRTRSHPRITRAVISQMDRSVESLMDRSMSLSQGSLRSESRDSLANPPSLVAPRLPHQDKLEPGGYIGKYQLLERLGQGAFGLVFIAYDTELEREVALKILNPAHLTNADVLSRFLQEARTTARISHPGIVTVLDCGQIITQAGDTTAFIAMELMHGESLTERLARHRRLTATQAIEIVRQIASALEAAHRVEVLHRDLKPDNIYLVHDPAVPSGERVKVFDFGLAKLGRVGQTQVESIFGTPRYMSPEQWRSSAQIDRRSDIYALGCILFELVTGQALFVGKLRELFDQHTSRIAPRVRDMGIDIPPALDDLIAAMLAKDPAHRPQTMEQVAHHLAGMARASTQNIAFPEGSSPHLRAPTAQPMAMPMRPPTAPPIPQTPMHAIPGTPMPAPMAMVMLPPQVTRSVLWPFLAFAVAVMVAVGIRWIA